MSPLATPDLTGETTEATVSDALSKIGNESAPELTQQRRRRLRDIFRPQANGDQDSW